jgi:hypothetical protein
MHSFPEFLVKLDIVCLPFEWCQGKFSSPSDQLNASCVPGLIDHRQSGTEAAVAHAPMSAIAAVTLLQTTSQEIT